METVSIISKLLEFQTSIETIKKDGKNTFFKKPDGKASSYATLPNILSEVKPILNSLKLVVTQPIINGVVYTVISDTESTESLKSGIALPLNLNAQQTGSAITYFRRYTISSLLSLEIDEDDDGNKASELVKPIKKEPLTPDHKNWQKVVDYLKGDGTITEVLKKYTIAADVETKLMDEVL